MYANFIYFLVALIVYATSGFFEAPAHTGLQGLIYTLGLTALFFLICQLVFDRIWKKSEFMNFESADYMISRAIMRLSLFSLLIFAVVIYLFKPQHIFSQISFFQWFPTLETLIFLCLFFLFLVMVWNGAWKVHNRVTGVNLPRKQFIFSNACFSLPALLPWLVISLLADILLLIPFKPVRTFLNTPTGEVSYVGICLVVISLLGPELIRRLWNCRSLEPGIARAAIEDVCRKTGLKYADILRWELFGGTMITAGVMGLVSRFRYILVTPALFNALNKAELEAVMLHEIGHVKRHHMLFYLLFFGIFLVCNFLFFQPLMEYLYVVQPLYYLFAMAGIQKQTAYPLLIAVVLIGGLVVYFRFVFGWFMRHFERQADIHVFEYLPSAQALISTFYKIVSISRQAMDKPNWHHFSIAQRVDFLEKCHQRPWMVSQHHRRVKQMIAGYLAVAAILVAIGYSINWGPARGSYNQFIADRIVSYRVDISADNAGLYAQVANHFYSMNQFQKAIDIYEKVLVITPENVEVLNNLSWLFSTCPDPAFRNPEKALAYAEKAVGLNQEAYVLDTYAEALFVSGAYEKALQISIQAMEKAREKKGYYQEQVARFEKKVLNPDG